MKRWMTMLLLAGPLLASAQDVWRCGPDGRSYADAPCEGGRPLMVADARSADQVAQARAVAVRDRQLADRLARERAERERQARAQGSGLTGIVETPLRSAARPVAAQPPAPKAKKPSRPSGAGTSRTAPRASPRARG